MTEHEQYDASYNECSHSLNELLRRLTRCSDASGDRRDIENMQTKLQVRHLTASSCDSVVFITIKSGMRLWDEADGNIGSEFFNPFPLFSAASISTPPIACSFSSSYYRHVILSRIRELSRIRWPNVSFL